MKIRSCWDLSGIRWFGDLLHERDRIWVFRFCELEEGGRDRVPGAGNRVHCGESHHNNKTNFKSVCFLLSPCTNNFNNVTNKKLCVDGSHLLPSSVEHGLASGLSCGEQKHAVVNGREGALSKLRRKLGKMAVGWEWLSEWSAPSRGYRALGRCHWSPGCKEALLWLQPSSGEPALIQPFSTP